MWRGNVRARYGEGGQGFEEPADHDPGVIFPGIGRAAVAEGPAQIPAEQSEAETPQGREGCVAVEIEFWGEGAEGVENTRDDEGDKSEEGNG